ncbi:MAG TPA: transposase [Chthoniobacterales bacterium]|jgi:REP element-mobilizing transposase RayT
MRLFPQVPPRLVRVFADAPVYFVTFCTYRRRRFLAFAPVHDAFVAFAEHARDAQNVAVGRYVLMPDHIHLFVSGDPTFRLGRWIGMLKQVLAKAIVRRASAEPIWQRGFFDHVLRSDESYGQKWTYMRENPVRAGLAARAEDWAYAGEIVVIDRA